ncbi:MAG: MATE family efflux transporter [Acidimicrobiales bacterium]
MAVPDRSIDKEILRLAVPALGALGAEPLYVLVDTAVVGHLGTPHLGGLGVAASVLTTAFFLFNFLAYGTTAAVARLFGAGRHVGAAEQAVQGAWLAVAIGTVLSIVGVVLAPAAVSAMGAGPLVRPHAVLYLTVSALGAPAVLIALVGVGYLRGMQDTKTTLVVALGSNLANLLIEIVLIFGLGMGVGASAAATVVAQYAAAIAYLVLIRRSVSASAISLRPVWRQIRVLIRVARDLFIRTGSLLAALAVATAMASRMGAVAIGTHQVAFQVWSFLALLLDALAIAGQAMVGRFLGAGDADRAVRAGRRMLQWGAVGGIGTGLLVVGARPFVLPLFTSDREVIELGLSVLLIVAVMQPINGVVFVLDGLLIGAGDLRYLAGAMAASSVTFIPLAIAIRMSGRGLVALWGAVCILMLTRLAALAWRWRSRRWVVVGSGP